MSSFFLINFTYKKSVIYYDNNKYNNMKRLKSFLVAVPLMVILLAGCASLPTFWGNSSKAVARQGDKIEAVQDKLTLNQDKKVDQVQQFSFATAYSLSKVTNTEPAIAVAKDMNSRIEAIMGLPELEKQKAMSQLVNNLISNNIAGEIQLARKDYEIGTIQKEEKFLLKQKDAEIDKALALSESVASKADASQNQLDKYKGWFGLSAVFMGLKQFFTTSLWVLLGLGVGFLILRVLASTNPIAGAIFSIVDVVCSWFVNMIKVIAPKAMTVANTVSGEVYHEAKAALNSVVDAVETVKLKQKATGVPATIEDLLNAAEAGMTDTDKAMIEKIKVEMGWAKSSTVTTVAVAPVVISTTPTTIATDVTKPTV